MEYKRFSSGPAVGGYGQAMVIDLSEVSIVPSPADWYGVNTGVFLRTKRLVHVQQAAGDCHGIFLNSSTLHYCAYIIDDLHPHTGLP